MDSHETNTNQHSADALSKPGIASKQYVKHRPWRTRGLRGRYRPGVPPHNNRNLESQEQQSNVNQQPSTSYGNVEQNQSSNETDIRPKNIMEDRSNQLYNNLESLNTYVKHNNFRTRGRGGRLLRPTNYINDNNNDHRNDLDNENYDNRHRSQSQLDKQTILPRRSRGRGRKNISNSSDNHEITSLQKSPNESFTSLYPKQGNESSSANNENESNAQSEIAERQLKTNTFECMICCDNISRYNQIWYCSNCYNIFHLKCAVEWCNKSIKSRNEAIANAQYPSLSQAPTTSTNNTISDLFTTPNEGYTNYRQERMNSIEWPCPTCREILYSRPAKYKCFCGKVVRPEVNRHLTPHSCGQLCGRRRPNIDCPHNCNTMCHPGRCAPCPLTSRRSCHCGKATKEVKCSTGSYTCNQVCGKTLLCGIHTCEKTCHSGSCSTCEEIVTINCHCGDQNTQKLCIELNNIQSKKNDHLTRTFECGRVCGRLLDCGKHYCNQKCHPGPSCGSCKFLSQNIKTCPCGSTLIKKSLLNGRKLCTDPMPTCENKCNKILICGPEKSRHRCQKKCHTGACPPCKLKTTAHCECKLSTKTIECSLMYEKIEDNNQVQFKQVEYIFSCEARCNRLKNCGRHRCNNKCCKFLKTSDSTLHKCDQICNKRLACGAHNCPEICHLAQCGDCTNIGWEELRCHCGGSVLYPPIPCGARRPACHRPCRRAHNCGHPVKHECHDDNETCAPCTVFVKKSCFCKSESKDSVYCYLSGYSCGRTCKKLLACKQHRCKRVCHDNECETPNQRGVILCSQPCPIIRYSCKHSCGIICHGSSPCPVTECRKMLEITCECGNKTDRLECFKVMKDVDNRNKVAMLNTNRSNQDTIIIDLSKKLPSKSSVELNDNSHLKRLDCDETCSILKRNKALAKALDIAQPDLKPTSIFGEDPLRLLKEATAQDYKFVSTTFNTLARFVKMAKESEKRFIFMQFPPHEKLRREVVHELAYHFNCTSESGGEEPFRHVVVRAYKNKSCVPEFSIEQLLPVSD